MHFVKTQIKYAFYCASKHHFIQMCYFGHFLLILCQQRPTPEVYLKQINQVQT